MKLKDYLESSNGYYCLCLDSFGLKTKIFEKFNCNKSSKILNHKIISFWSGITAGKIIQYINIECKNLNDIKDFFSKEN